MRLDFLGEKKQRTKKKGKKKKLDDHFLIPQPSGRLRNHRYAAATDRHRRVRSKIISEERNVCTVPIVTAGFWTIDKVGKEKRWRFGDFNHDETCLELLAAIALEARPIFRAGNDRRKVAHHLAAVADAQRKAVAADTDLSDSEKQAKFTAIEAEREAEKAKLQTEKDAEAEQYGIYHQRIAPPAGAPRAPGAPPVPRVNQNQNATPTKADISQAQSVRRNPKTQEKAYLIGGKWYKESQLK